jgi:hypothetical protein
VAEDGREAIESFGGKVTETPVETSTVILFESSSLRV